MTASPLLFGKLFEWSSSTRLSVSMFQGDKTWYFLIMLCHKLTEITSCLLMISNNSDIVQEVIHYHYWYNGYQGKYYQDSGWDQHSIILGSNHNIHKDNCDLLNWYHRILSTVIITWKRQTKSNLTQQKQQWLTENRGKVIKWFIKS